MDLVRMMGLVQMTFVSCRLSVIVSGDASNILEG
jgi:hypothetical protein